MLLEAMAGEGDSVSKSWGRLHPAPPAGAGFEEPEECWGEALLDPAAGRLPLGLVCCCCCCCCPKSGLELVSPSGKVLDPGDSCRVTFGAASAGGSMAVEGSGSRQRRRHQMERRSWPGK